MIAAYNLKQVLLALLNIFGAIFGFAVAFFFFLWVAVSITAAGLGFEAFASYSWWFAAVMLVFIAVTGFLHWRGGKGLSGYAESSVFISLEPGSGGAVCQRARIVPGDSFDRQFAQYPIGFIFTGGTSEAYQLPLTAAELAIASTRRYRLGLWYDRALKLLTYERRKESILP